MGLLERISLELFVHSSIKALAFVPVALRVELLLLLLLQTEPALALLGAAPIPISLLQFLGPLA